MGHASADTTYRNYWVTNIKDLNASINNPFSETFHQNKNKLDDNPEDIELQRTKKFQLLQIIHKYNQIIASCISENLPVLDVQRQIFESMPNLEEMLRTLAASVSGSSSGCSSGRGEDTRSEQIPTEQLIDDLSDDDEYEIPDDEDDYEIPNDEDDHHISDDDSSQVQFIDN